MDDAVQPEALIISVHSGGGRMIRGRALSVLGTLTWQEQEDDGDNERHTDQREKATHAFKAVSPSMLGATHKYDVSRTGKVLVGLMMRASASSATT
jgi:hypothetical protein